MSRQINSIFAFNRGIVSPLGLARTEQKRIAMAAETMTNWMPRVLGSMSIRPGLQYIGATYANSYAEYIPFVFSTTDTALLEFTDSLMRVWVNDALVTRNSVTTAIANGTFNTDLASWTDTDEAGGVSAWVAGGYMGLTGNGTAAAIREQTVTVAAGSQNVEHGVRIVINRGPVTLRVGSTSGGDDYISETTLATGTHSLAFTPTGPNVYVRFFSRLKRIVYVDSCEIEAAGVITVTSPYLNADLEKVRDDQSADVIFLSCSGYPQYKVERRALHSWSIVKYLPEDGPFLTQNIGPITMTPTALSGNTTLTASAAYFKSTNVGSLFKLVSTGQKVTASIVAENNFTNAIQVEGVGTQRAFTINISNTFVATLTLQYSLISNTGPWTDVSGKTWTAPVATTYTDGLDNQIAYYRIGVKTGGFTSGRADTYLQINTGSITGICRMTGYTNATAASVEVITDFGSTTATDTWSEGKWSDRRGWPSAVRFHEGRLWWAGKNGITGSISDAFNSFDSSVIGASGPIDRTIGSGPVDTINWLISLQRLLVGAQGAEFSVRSSALDEPLTPTNFNLKPASTQGSSAVAAKRIDQRAVYVDRSGIRIYELSFDTQSYDYGSNDITEIVPELAYPGIVRMEVQRKPDTRIHCVRSDGKVMVGIYDHIEQVLAWVLVETNGTVEDVVVLPGTNGSTEDKVYYEVNRTINGSTVRYLEKWAEEIQCRGATVSKQADSFVTFTNSPASTTISGLSHLIGESVVVWQDGFTPADSSTGLPKTYTVSGAGTITVDTAATTGIVGLPYTAQFKSAKLGTQPSIVSTLLNQQKRISHIGFVLAYYHPKGIQYGSDFTHLDDLPEIEQGTVVDQNTIGTSYDEQEFEFNSTWDTDSRLCLQGNAPRPCTVLAAVIDMEIHN